MYSVFGPCNVYQKETLKYTKIKGRVSPSHKNCLVVQTMNGLSCVAAVLSLQLFHLHVTSGASHERYWYEPSNWALGWQTCSLDRLSRRSTGTTYRPDELPEPHVSFTDEELRARLSEEQYWVTQKKGIYFGITMSGQGGMI